MTSVQTVMVMLAMLMLALVFGLVVRNEVLLQRRRRRIRAEREAADRAIERARAFQRDLAALGDELDTLFINGSRRR